VPRLHVALTPADAAPADVQIVVDCIRATSTIAQALAAGYGEIVCVAEIADAVALRAPGVVLGGERGGVAIDGFDLGNSPDEYADPRGACVVLTTTNGTRAILAAAAEARVVLAGSLTCLDAVAAAAAAATDGGNLAVRCAGVRGALALDDVYTAGRFAQLLADAVPGIELTDGARAACAVAAAYADPLAALLASESARDLDGTGHEGDVARCAEVSALDVVPVVERAGDGAVSLRALARPLRGGG
jgi:2-phosphosulfolactate phosphatase